MHPPTTKRLIIYEDVPLPKVYHKVKWHIWVINHLFVVVTETSINTYPGFQKSNHTEQYSWDWTCVNDPHFWSPGLHIFSVYFGKSRSSYNPANEKAPRTLDHLIGTNTMPNNHRYYFNWKAAWIQNVPRMSWAVHDKDLLWRKMKRKRWTSSGRPAERNLKAEPLNDLV